ncbi:MAG: signal recognition particle-docking protein FtsY [Thermodesulfobacteriota bacterium]
MVFSLFKKKKTKDLDPEKNTETDRQNGLDDEAGRADGPAAPASSPPLPPSDDRSADAPKNGFYNRLRRGLEKTRRFLSTDVDKIFSSGKKLDAHTLDDLEELLITADMGVKATTELIARLSKASFKITEPEHLKAEIKNILRPYLEGEDGAAVPGASPARPHVIMVVGVNGVGKTTTIGKLAARYTAQGKKVLLVAADTFRAAAIDQLAIWAQRTGTEIIRHKENSDPAAVAYDGVEAARARGSDIVIVDTAGRLHTKVNLMEELKKIKRSIAKTLPEAPHEVLLVLDATTGQNAISQTELFTKAADVTGLVLTKLDGTAKGGIAINLCHSFHIPLKYIGVGEQMEDLQPFDAQAFLDAMF